MNLSLPEDVLDQMALEQAHFDAAPQAFFEAWKRGAQIAGHEWFGDGTREGLQRATTKWDLRPNMLMLNDALGVLSINLFVRDMPRLSVDIDVVYLPWQTPRDEALQAINQELAAIAARLAPLTVQRVFENALQEREQTVETFDVAMTLVAAGYGIAIAPAARLASYLRRGIAVRPLAGAPTIVMAYLLRRNASLSDTQARFARRARLVS